MFGEILSHNLGSHCHLLDQHVCCLCGPALFHSGGDPGDLMVRPMNPLYPVVPVLYWQNPSAPSLLTQGEEIPVCLDVGLTVSCPGWLWMTDPNPVIKIQPPPGPDLETALSTTPPLDALLISFHT